MRALPFPAKLVPWIVGHFQADGEWLKGRFGDPGYIETDTYRTAGGHEWNWAYEFPDGSRVLIELHVPVKSGVLYADPPDAYLALQNLCLIGCAEFTLIQPKEPYLPPGASTTRPLD